MDIKLRARLSAYSKIESISSTQSNVPDPDALAAGHVLGVNDTGKYTLFPKIDTSYVDTLFEDVIGPEAVEKSEIDSLFTNEEKDIAVTKDDINTLFESQSQPITVDKETIDTLFENEEQDITVDKSTIDTLFEGEEEDESVSKEDIDTLFTSSSVNTGTVSYADIDSLFN